MLAKFLFFTLAFWLLSPASLLASEQWWCEKWDATPCTSVELADPVHYRQIMILPTGFVFDEEQLFRNEVSRLIRSMSKNPIGVFASSKKEQLLYIAQWLPGGELGSPESTFSGAVAQHPIRDKALTLKLDEVVNAVEHFRSSVFYGADPLGVFVLFNTLEEKVTANATPPSFLGRSYGIAKVTRADLHGNHIPVHELAHAALNFVDEYVEAGFENMNVSVLDYLTPLAVFKNGWGGFGQMMGKIFGFYDYRVSEILAANGSDNVDTSKYPSRVATTGYKPNVYEYEGGMFFGNGTYHDRGKNIMGGGALKRGEDDGFDAAHSGSQWQVIEQVFDHPDQASRPNDRIRNAGPGRGLPSGLGAHSNVMLFDADKHHRFHPTRSYEVQVGWNERDWKVCWKYKVVPYPCYDTRWVTAQKLVSAKPRTLSLKSTKLYGLAKILQKTMCHMGLDEFKNGEDTIRLCQASLPVVAEMFLPTFEFPLPYQNVEIPTSQWLTKYQWRFRTNNGTYRSGWTGWVEFYRTL